MSIRLDQRNLDLEAVPKLNLVSVRQLEYKLGLKRDYLRQLAAKAGAHYDPFIKPEKHRPFQKIFKKPKKRIIDNPDEELKLRKAPPAGCGHQHAIGKHLYFYH